MKHLVSNVPIFAGLSDKAVEMFLEHSRKMEVADGEVIARECELNKCMYIILSGQVRIIKNLDTPAPVTLALLGPGESFGEMCILETLPRSATGQAVGKAEVLRVEAAAFYHLYQNMPEQYCVLLLNIARDLSRRLRHLNEAYVAHLSNLA